MENQSPHLSPSLSPSPSPTTSSSSSAAAEPAAELAAPEVMALTAPSEGEVFENVKDFIKFVNTYASSQDYAVVIARSKRSKKDIKRKVCFRCDRGKKSPGPFGRKRQHTGTRMTQCPFNIMTKLDPMSQRWSFKIQ